jgi:nitrous oxidase accessory protein
MAGGKRGGGSHCLEAKQLRQARPICAAGGLEALEPRLLLTTVSTVAQLYAAVNNGVANDTITVKAGTYELTSPLAPKGGQTIRGAGAGATIITAAASWSPSTSTLPDNGINISSCDATAYLFSFAYSTKNVTISDMTLTGPALHGALLASDCDGLQLSGLRIDDFLWSGVRTFLMANSSFHDNTFVDTGGRWQSGGVPGVSGGTTGGGIYLTYVSDSTFYNNTMYKTQSLPERNFYGMKHREAKRCRYYNNTLLTNFSMEFPFENDQYVEIDHNYMTGTVSIPKYAGGPIPSGGYTFHIHHNYFNQSYAIEFARNGVEIDHNLFNFSTDDDGGNLITNFQDSATPASDGWVTIHDNLIKNPGRGLYASNGQIFNNFSFYNNHVVGSTTVTPRTDGMFGLPTGTTFSTVTIKDNIFEFSGQARGLFRNTASYASVVQNNTLTNVSDSSKYANPSTGDPRGPLAPLYFAVGAGSRYVVDGWNCRYTGGVVAVAAPIGPAAASSPAPSTASPSPLDRPGRRHAAAQATTPVGPGSAAAAVNFLQLLRPAPWQQGAARLSILRII